MSDGYKTKDYRVKTGNITVANDTLPVSEVVPVSSQDSLYILVKVVASSVTAGSGITAKLMESYDGIDWEAVGNRGEVSITGDGTFEIAMVINDSSDAAQLPLWPLLRVDVVASSDATCVVENVYVSRRM